jgi:hypothetical protein
MTVKKMRVAKSRRPTALVRRPCRTCPTSSLGHNVLANGTAKGAVAVFRTIQSHMTRPSVRFLARHQALQPDPSLPTKLLRKWTGIRQILLDRNSLGDERCPRRRRVARPSKVDRSAFWREEPIGVGDLAVRDLRARAPRITTRIPASTKVVSVPRPGTRLPGPDGTKARNAAGAPGLG